MIKDYEVLAISRAWEDRFFTTDSALKAQLQTSGKDEDDEDTSYILQVQDNVGLIEIKGMLTNSNHYYNKWFGMLAYDEIRKATFQAIEAGVGGMMYLVSSPGGRVSGMQPVAELISSLPVPTLTYTDEQMASAALFLGIQSDHVYAGDFAEVGSVGVLATVMDYSEAMKKEGISAKRFRSGDLKAVGDPRFKMSAKEEKYMAEQVMLYAEKFYGIVAEGRGMPRPMLDSLEITSGRTFIGAQAETVGLVDGITTFDKAFAKIAGLAKKNIDSRDRRTVPYGSL